MNGEITTRVRLIQNQTVSVIAEHALSEPHFWRRLPTNLPMHVRMSCLEYQGDAICIEEPKEPVRRGALGLRACKVTTRHATHCPDQLTARFVNDKGRGSRDSG